jgi:putative ABC transport system permease protein
MRVGDLSGPWITVVGVVSDLKLNWYDPEPRPTIYRPHTQAVSRSMYLMVRAAGDPLTLALAIRMLARRIDPLQPLGDIRTLAFQVEDSVSPVRVIGVLLLMCGALAVVFSGAGIYGVLAHWVAARRREFGVRLALGASASDLSRLVARQAFSLVAIGLVIAVPCGLVVLGVYRRAMFGIATADTATVSAVVVFVLVVAGAATVAPAGRAGRVDPAALMQAE